MHTATSNSVERESTPTKSTTTTPHASLVELQYRSLENVSAAKLARGLGYFSLALGLAETVFPKALARAAGLTEERGKYLPLLGAREIAHGISILKGRKPTGAVWTRVGGDAVDLAFLGGAFTDGKTDKTRLTVATAAVAMATMLDVICAKKLSRSWSESDGNSQAPSTVGQSSARHSTRGEGERI